jgi:hypothetical protein
MINTPTEGYSPKLICEDPANGTDIMRMIPAMEMIPRMIETIVKSRDPSFKRYTVMAAAAPATNDTSELNPCVARSTFSGTIPAIRAPQSEHSEQRGEEAVLQTTIDKVGRHNR